MTKEGCEPRADPDRLDQVPPSFRRHWEPEPGEPGGQSLAKMVEEDGSAYDLAPPRADCLIESLRAFGYTTPAAVADLVDNSISAAARNVWISCYWAGASSWIRIVDDGVGMSEEQLRDAMRAGSQNPRIARAPSDLGRFGLGLKTASFSQCRLLTVASKQSGSDLAARCWDRGKYVRVASPAGLG